MQNKVYYGEYSLKHWINMMLKGDIVLPWYQRTFVWDKAQIESLIKTLDNNQFVPPIIIGAVKEEGEWKNYILDGQQRLTSILLTKCNVWIDKKTLVNQKPNTEVKQLADDIIESEEDKEEDVDIDIKAIKWTFKDVIKNKNVNTEELKNIYYKRLFTESKEDNFFKNHFLGFAYIKPGMNASDEDQSKFYSDTFRNINVGGSKLNRAESRKSLYFLKQELKNFFAPEFLENTRIETSSKESGWIDFIKYLSISAQFKKNSSFFKYGGRNWEKNEDYYQKYIMAVVDRNPSNELLFDISYPDHPYRGDRIERLKDTIANLGIPILFHSIVDIDVYYFGLVYFILFMNKQIDETQKDNLKTALESKILVLKGRDNHKTNPSALKYLKDRVESSIAVYRNYLKA